MTSDLPGIYIRIECALSISATIPYKLPHSALEKNFLPTSENIERPSVSYLEEHANVVISISLCLWTKARRKAEQKRCKKLQDFAKRRLWSCFLCAQSPSTLSDCFEISGIFSQRKVLLSLFSSLMKSSTMYLRETP